MLLAKGKMMSDYWKGNLFDGEQGSVFSAPQQLIDQDYAPSGSVSARARQAYAAEALRLVKELGFENHISAGTTYTNVATAYNAFGEDEKALALFEKAKAVYEADEKTSPSLLGGLYNNLALTYVSLGQFEPAFDLYEKALQVMENVPGGVLEQAITYLNMADAVCARDGEEASEAQVEQWLDTAYDLLIHGDAPHDGYYAFVCEKCAPGFSYYGYFLAANELNKRSRSIYERD